MLVREGDYLAGDGEVRRVQAADEEEEEERGKRKRKGREGGREGVSECTKKRGEGGATSTAAARHSLSTAHTHHNSQIGRAHV